MSDDGMTFDECVALIPNLNNTTVSIRGNFMPPCIPTITRIGWRLIELADAKKDGGAAAGFLRGVCFALECGVCRESAINILRRAYDVHQLGWKARPGAHGGALPLATELIDALVDEVRQECFAKFARKWYPIAPKAKRRALTIIILTSASAAPAKRARDLELMLDHEEGKR